MDVCSSAFGGSMGGVMWRIAGPCRSSRSRVSSAESQHPHDDPSSKTLEEHKRKSVTEPYRPLRRP